MKGVYEVKKEIFFNWMTEVEEYITKTWDLDLMKESLFSVIELLMIGIPYCHNVLIVVQWILLKNILQLNWTRNC